MLNFTLSPLFKLLKIGFSISFFEKNISSLIPSFFIKPKLISTFNTVPVNSTNLSKFFIGSTGVFLISGEILTADKNLNNSFDSGISFVKYKALANLNCA